MTIDDQGTIELSAADGTAVTLDAQAGELRAVDANGNSLTTGANGITIQDQSGNTVQLGASGIALQADERDHPGRARWRWAAPSASR